MNTVQPIRSQQQIAEIKEELKKIDEKYYIMFVLGINTGLRVSDILTLKVSDIYKKRHIVIVEQKTRKNKRFLINDKLQAEVSEYIKKNALSEDKYLIQSRKGDNKPISRVQAYRVLNQAAALLGLDEIGTHTMRKTFGYWHYKQNKDVAILQEIFNHSSPSITLRYIGINDDIKDETIKGFYL